VNRICHGSLVQSCREGGRARGEDAHTTTGPDPDAVPPLLRIQTQHTRKVLFPEHPSFFRCIVGVEDGSEGERGEEEGEGEGEDGEDGIGFAGF
jgi:hypothetical protein